MYVEWVWVARKWYFQDLSFHSLSESASRDGSLHGDFLVRLRACVCMYAQIVVRRHLSWCLWLNVCIGIFWHVDVCMCLYLRAYVVYAQMYTHIRLSPRDEFLFAFCFLLVSSLYTHIHRMYVHVCMCVCIYMYIYIHVGVCTYESLCVHMHIMYMLDR